MSIVILPDGFARADDLAVRAGVVFRRINQFSPAVLVTCCLTSAEAIRLIRRESSLSPPPTSTDTQSIVSSLPSIALLSDLHTPFVYFARLLEQVNEAKQELVA